MIIPVDYRLKPIRTILQAADMLREMIREVTGIYNQWPSLIFGESLRIPIDRMTEAVASNDNQP